MTRAYFQALENLTHNETCPLNDVIEQLAFNEQGLIPVITQDAVSKNVLMLAWMNKTALETTLATGRMTYWSRSRGELWEKGAGSGHTQELVAMAFDCDGDTILCHVHQKGAACHTGRPDCFYLDVDNKHNQVRIIGSGGA